LHDGGRLAAARRRRDSSVKVHKASFMGSGTVAPFTNTL
jgi:hypothetical protein